ncbi:MAG TPA: type IV-A pilus assembly ATPase PilB [Oligoflexia bacterium]|nr:type IV-A pilus assembly ATPase PilB [Oligoflexia bacterium]HMP26954.1 type IV-A pilus assembly ATPase PilB [Oligoflexia bacterium]
MSSQIGEILVKSGLITESQLGDALKAQQEAGSGSLNHWLVKLNLIAEKDLADILSQQYGVEIVQLESYTIPDDLLEIIPQNLSQKHGILPLVKNNNILTVATADPSNLTAINDLKFITGLDVQVVLTTESDLKAYQEKTYEKGVSYDQIMQDIEDEEIQLVEAEEEINLKELEKASEDAPVVKLVNAILIDAIKKRASDIHIEPYETVFRVRFRIDGVLYEIMKPPPRLKNAITSRIKIMANLDIAERRLPQDGRIKFKLSGSKEMDFRVSVLPTLFGEKVVMRLLDKSNLQLDMLKLGFEEKQLKDFKDSIYKPHGMVLVTGPTGSGKTTTLYSALAELNKITTNISTAEDPVEFNIAGINQVQMQDNIGLNFAAALRSFLRQDPDVVMVGEIRDYETAEIAIKASLTGHLVLSTLHTNDAPATINRLLNMGVEPFLVASSINCILAQRLARRLCKSCAKEVEVNPEILVNIGIPAAEARHMKVKEGKGCPECSNTGYRGRVALYEVMPMGEELREFVLNGASTAEIKKEAVRLGMMTLRASGLMRLKEGITSIEEVLRTTTND